METAEQQVKDPVEVATEQAAKLTYVQCRLDSYSILIHEQQDRINSQEAVVE